MFPQPSALAATPLPEQSRISFCLLTGFLGAGKTTLLRRLLQEEGMGTTAVIINEFGEASLDHLLVRDVAPDVVQLPNGCLCCVTHRDLVETLRDLVSARDRGALPWFDRLVLETSGLADPAPILYTISSDPFLDQILRLEGIVTCADGALIQAQAHNHPEAQAQLALADVILLTRSDLTPISPPVQAWLGLLNPEADRLDARALPSLAPVLFAARQNGLRHLAPRAAAQHSHGLSSLTFELSETLSRFGFARMLAQISAAKGDDILRIKGLLRFSDAPERTAIIHAVQHSIFPPEWRADWPDEDPRHRLVIIGHNLDLDALLTLLAPAGARLWQKATPALPLAC